MVNEVAGGNGEAGTLARPPTNKQVEVNQNGEPYREVIRVCNYPCWLCRGETRTIWKLGIVGILRRSPLLAVQLVPTTVLASKHSEDVAKLMM